MINIKNVGYSEDEQELNIPELQKIHIQDLHVVFISSWDVETAIANKDSGLSRSLIDTVFLYLPALPARQTNAVTPFRKGEVECREGKRL